MTECVTILICGSRHWEKPDPIIAVLRQYDPATTTVLHGGALGADALTEKHAHALGFSVQVCRADWQAHGKAAGPIRNQRMLDEGRPSKVYAFPLAGSRGTWDMVNRARAAGIPVVIDGEEGERTDG